MKNWILSLGFYQGVLFGMRTYESEESTQYVIYLPFIDICFELLNNDENSEE